MNKKILDDVHLEDEDVHQRRHHRGEDDGVDPFVDGLVGLAPLAGGCFTLSHNAP